MSWFIDTVFTPEVLILVITAVVALAFGICIGRGTVERVEAPQVPSLQRNGISVEQLRQELSMFAKELPATASLPVVNTSATDQERDLLQDQLEDVANDLQESAVTIDAQKRRNAELAQAIKDRDELLGHIQRHVLGQPGV
ncbi:MAG: hypothetical protein ACTII7_09450 [Galactobacter sp.]